MAEDSCPDPYIHNINLHMGVDLMRLTRHLVVFQRIVCHNFLCLTRTGELIVIEYHGGSILMV